MQSQQEALEKLARSKFRSRFRLDESDRAYIREKGMNKIRAHTEDFVRMKLAPAEPQNDGKQTPMHGHPVFKAMHATAFCCRGCMEKWYQVPKGTELTEDQQRVICDFLMAWIERQL